MGRGSTRSYHRKQINSILLFFCSVVHRRWRQNVLRTWVTHCHILTSSVIYHWTDARQHGVYLLIWQQALLRGRTNGAFPQVSKTEKDAIWHMILTYSLRLSCPRQRVKISFRTVNIQYVILWGDLFDKIGWRVGKTWVLMWAYSI